MLALYIALGVAVLLILLLFLPMELRIKYNSVFSFKITCFGIPVFGKKSGGKKPKKAAKDAKKVKQSSSGKAGEYISEHGFTGAVKEICGAVKEIAARIKQLLPRTKITKLDLDIWITAPVAALTAIEYGAVCAAVYPALGAITAVVGGSDIKNVTIKADYGGKKSRAVLDFRIKSRLIWVIKSFLPVREILVRRGLVKTKSRQISGGGKFKK